MNIDDLLRVVVEREASDLHLKTGSPPVLRIHGALTPYGDSPVTPEEMQAALEHITTEKQRESFVEEMELDFAYSITGLARFRVNAALQRGTISLVFRQVNWRIPPSRSWGCRRYARF
jgi:twitching motility protein PilT